MRQIEWTPDGTDSLNEILAYYDTYRAGEKAAWNIYEKIIKEIELLKLEETKTKQTQELKDIGVLDVYELSINPWKVYYKIQSDNKKVFVLFVLDARRNIEEILISKVIDNKI
ncbi:MAG: type II toxin-antitoxin system RelE/ParE family toxin [Spirochaetaceae bacterium]|jgi:plasmid stabilization system protein ParE|nr:type II toxin-antitoxin system RelE/ParE family toxin [Spirochaetaceae bacterium]